MNITLSVFLFGNPIGFAIAMLFSGAIAYHLLYVVNTPAMTDGWFALVALIVFWRGVTARREYTKFKLWERRNNELLGIAEDIATAKKQRLIRNALLTSVVVWGGAFVLWADTTKHQQNAAPFAAILWVIALVWIFLALQICYRWYSRTSNARRHAAQEQAARDFVVTLALPVAANAATPAEAHAALPDYCNALLPMPPMAAQFSKGDFQQAAAQSAPKMATVDTRPSIRESFSSWDGYKRGVKWNLKHLPQTVAYGVGAIILVKIGLPILVGWFATNYDQPQSRQAQDTAPQPKSKQVQAAPIAPRPAPSQDYQAALAARDDLYASAENLFYGTNGVTQDQSAAFTRYFVAADSGKYPPAQYMVAYMYENGLGDKPRDINQAIKWYKKCAERGGELGQKAKAKLAELQSAPVVARV